MRQQLIRLAPRPLLEIARVVREAYRRIGYLRARWPRPFGTRPPITLAVCAIFRDEARYLAEWVTFHRVQGVERFYLYDNLSTDDWRSELGPEIAAGIVEVRHWPDVPGQASAYEDCLRRHRTDTRWIAFIDIDEFLFSPTGRPLPEVLREFDTHPGVVVNWRVYGTNGWEHPPDGLVIDNYPLRAPDDHPANRLVKSIVYPRNTLGATTQPAHYFRLRGNPVGEDMRPAFSTPGNRPRPTCCGSTTTTPSPRRNSGVRRHVPMPTTGSSRMPVPAPCRRRRRRLDPAVPPRAGDGARDPRRPLPSPPGARDDGVQRRAMCEHCNVHPLCRTCAGTP